MLWFRKAVIELPEFGKFRKRFYVVYILNDYNIGLNLYPLFMCLCTAGLPISSTPTALASSLTRQKMHNHKGGIGMVGNGGE
jgi:hypothetical protein